MKKICVIIISALLMIGLVACMPKLPWEITESNIKITDKDLAIELEPGLTTSEGATMSIRNRGGSAVAFGAEYEIQTQIYNVWYHIDIKGTKWKASKKVLNNGESYMEELHWDEIYGKLPKGKYRLVKPYKKNGETLYAAVGFNIN